MKGLFTLRALTIDQIMEIINLAIKFKNGLVKKYPGQKMVNLFYENSTRT